MAICDSDPFKLHYTWSLWRTGHARLTYWRPRATPLGGRSSKTNWGLLISTWCRYRTARQSPFKGKATIFAEDAISISIWNWLVHLPSGIKPSRQSTLSGSSGTSRRKACQAQSLAENREAVKICSTLSCLTYRPDRRRSAPEPPATGAPGIDGCIGVRCPPRPKEEVMHTPMPSSVALMSARDADPFAQAQMAAAAYLARYGGRTLETYRYDLRTFFQCALMLVSTSSRPSGPTWSCGAAPWKSGDWLPRPSTGGCPPSAGSITSPTLTAGFHRTQRSTPAGPRSTRAKGAGSTEASSADSSSRPSATTPTMRPWPPCLA